MGNSQAQKEIQGTEVQKDSNEVLFKLLNKNDILYLCRDLTARGVIVNAVSIDGSYIWLSNSNVVKAEINENKLLDYLIFQPPFFPKGERQILVPSSFTSIDIDDEIIKLKTSGTNVIARSPQTEFGTNKYIFIS